MSSVGSIQNSIFTDGPVTFDWHCIEVLKEWIFQSSDIMCYTQSINASERVSSVSLKKWLSITFKNANIVCRCLVPLGFRKLNYSLLFFAVQFPAGPRGSLPIGKHLQVSRHYTCWLIRMSFCQKHAQQSHQPVETHFSPTVTLRDRKVQEHEGIVLIISPRKHSHISLGLLCGYHPFLSF